MILNKYGDTFQYDGIDYAIGDIIVATDASEYEGLVGRILEIRDGADKDTENETPDIYCSFEVPLFENDIKALEETFSDLYEEPKTIDDITLDMVIMAPEMIVQVDKRSNNVRKIKLYAVCEEWVYDGDETGQTTTLFATKEAAMKEFKVLIATKAINGIIVDITQRYDYHAEDIDEDEYSCYVDGFCEQNHYHISVEEKELLLTPSSLEHVRKLAQDITYYADFLSQIETWDEVADMTSAQYSKMISDPELPERIRKAVDMNDVYWSMYWQSVSEAAFQIVKEAQGAGCNANPEDRSS